MIRIMSFNIRCSDVNGVTWQERRPLVSEQILKIMPDSVGVQEAHTRWMAYLRKALGEQYACVGVGRENGRRRGEHSAIFYRTDKYTLIAHGDFWLSETPKKPSMGWDAACTRVCTWAHLKEKNGAYEYVHINTHFDHRGFLAQKNSVALVHAKAKEFSGLPVVFTADLNIPEGGEIYGDMVSSVLKDSKFLAPDTMGHITYHGGEEQPENGLIIDYVLVNPFVKPLVYRVLTEGVDGRMVSDHFPIYADCELRKYPD